MILTIKNFQHAMCRFVPEMTKVKGDGPFPGKTVYQMVVAIQKYLHINKIMWRLVDSTEFIDLQTVLDNVMQECAAKNVGVTKRQLNNNCGEKVFWGGCTKQASLYCIVFARY